MKRVLFLLNLLLLTIVGGGELWAQTSLFTADFTTWATQTASTKGANTFSENTSVVFYNNSDTKKFSITNGTGVNLPDNNLASNYFMAIPLTGINGSITLTITHESVSGKQVKYSYVLGAGETSYITSTAGGTKSTIQDAENGATSMTTTIDCAEESAMLYIGRYNSNSENETPIKSITVTTPSGSTLQLKAAASYAWTFSGNETADASADAAVLENGTYNFEIKNAAIETVSSTNVDGLANSITKRVYFNGMGNTTDKYVHVKVQGPSKISVFGLSGSGERSLVINCNGTTTNVALDDAAVSSGSYLYTDTEAVDVYVYSSNSGIYLYGVKVQPLLTQFEFNADEVLYYKDNSTREFINSTTFEQNTTYDYLRLKLIIDPDYDALGDNKNFTVTSSNSSVLDVSTATFTKATNQRIYVSGVKVMGTGTATLTFTFNGSDNYAGPVSFTQSFTVTAAQAPTISLSTPSTTTNVAVNTSIVLTANRIVTAVGETITGTLNDTPITFTLTNGNTLTYTPSSNLENETTYTVVLNANQVQGSNGMQNTQQTYTFTTVEGVATLKAVSDKVWNFSDWSTGNYTSQLIENENIEIISNNAMTVGSSSKSFTDADAVAADNLGTLSFTQRMATGGQSGASNRLLHIKVTPGSTIQVVAASQNNSDTRTLSLYKGAYGTTPVATLSASSDLTKLKYTYSGDVDEHFYIGTSGGMGIYYIKVSSNKKSVSIRSAGNQPGASQSAPITDATSPFNSLIVFEVDDINNLFTAGPIDSNLFEVESSDPSVIDVSSVTFSASSDDLSKSRIGMYGLRKGSQGGSAVITLHYKGNENYAEATTSFTRYAQGPQPFSISLSDVSVQNSQKTNIVPKIVNGNGDHIGFDDGGNLVIVDDEASVDYTQYFDFTYSIANNDAGLTLDATDNSVVVSAKGENYVGKTAVVTVTATPKSAYASSFTNGSSSGTLTVTVTRRAGANYLKFYLDKEKTTQVIDQYSYTLDGSTTVIEGFPNGRIIYVDVNQEVLAADAETVDEIWFSYNVGSSKTVSRASGGKNDYGAKLYLANLSRGGMVPIHLDGSQTGDVYVNFLCYKRSGSSYESVGSVIPVRFSISTHSRPAGVTYDPATTGLDRSTAQSVDAVGTVGSGNAVYAKFSSTGTNYTIEGLLNEPNVIYDIERTGVFSTEVAGRKISGVQINAAGDGDYVSEMTTNWYNYLFATTLKLSQYTYTIDLDNSPSITIPTVTASYYDKVKKENIDESSGEKITITYSVQNYNGANVSVDANTGEVTLGSTSGMAIVTVNYQNGNSYTVNKRSSTMEDATTTYTIYLTKSGEHLPKIEPVSQKFYPSISVKVTADDEWDTWYVIKNVGDEAPAASAIVSGGTKVGKNTNTTFSVTDTKVVYAAAYDGASSYTKVISETYTLGEEVLPPYFVPAGLNGSYPHYYYTPTLGVEARTQTTGSLVYYTIGIGSAPADPVIGAEGTYRYDGLQGITLTDGGTAYIKAIAYKDGIQSSVVTGTYIYSDLQAPYFNVNGSGAHTSGTVDVSATDRITIGSSVDPGTLTLAHYYTLDGSEPSTENGIRATTYFMALKTITAKAISVLLDATGAAVSTSSVTTVTFRISGGNVWEANDDTAPGGVLSVDDGLIISADQNVEGVYYNTGNNSGTKINQKSWASGNSSNITYAQPHVMVTFGGFNLESWKDFDINDESLGTPLDGVGTYNLKCNPTNDNNSGKDAWDEQGYMYSHVNTGETTSYDGHYYTGVNTFIESSKPTTVHEKTFKLPAQGTFVKFEPDMDGNVTIWALQQGAIHYQNDSKLCDRFVRRRPVYFLDEQGNSIRATEAVSSARLSAHWNTIINGYAANGKNWFTPLGEKQDGVANNFYNQDESEQIYNMFMDYFQKRGDYADATTYGSGTISVGDQIQPIPIHTASRASTPITERGGHNSDNSTDMTGYVLASGGYVRYTFPVQAGKTYYFFGHATKIGIRGFRFVPTESASRAPVGIDENSETMNVSSYSNEAVNVTLSRTFKKDTWAALVLPFSVSAKQVEEVFGANTEVVHFKDIERGGRTIVFKHHKQQMMVAGTPVVIWPEKDVVNPVFSDVHFENYNEVETMTGTDDSYSMIGTYVKRLATDDTYALKRYDYYFGTDGKLYRYNSTNPSNNATAIKGTRAWLRPKDAEESASREMTLGFSSDDVVEEFTTGIHDMIVVDGIGNYDGTAAGSSAVYNINGQKVSDGSLKGLPKGVYIVNGKKVVID